MYLEGSSLTLSRPNRSIPNETAASAAAEVVVAAAAAVLVAALAVVAPAARTGFPSLVLRIAAGATADAEKGVAVVVVADAG